MPQWIPTTEAHLENGVLGVGCCYDDENDENDDDDDGGVMVLVRTEDDITKSPQLVAKKLVVGGCLKLATPRKRSFRER